MHSFTKKKATLYSLAVFACSVVLFVAYLHIYLYVFGKTLPKTEWLRRKNEALHIEAQMLGRSMESYAEQLEALQVRDEEIYRSIFGLSSIPSSVRDASIQTGTRYEDLEYADRSGHLKNLCSFSDMVMKKAYVQSKSYDEIDLMLSSADLMATSIPAIMPIVPDPSKYRISSSFGYREHPVLGYRRFHEGVDFSIKPGFAVYATGDGVVEQVKIERRGYGRQVVIDHGFGYKTRYAHCKTILVAEGMKVKRGEKIAETGNSGLTSGPHLHYEVIYKGRHVNPYHYFDRDMPLDQYRDLVDKVASSSEKMMLHPMHADKSTHSNK